MMQDFTAGGSRFWPWAEHVVFWVMNLALIGFVITLLADQQWGEKFFVPFQGLAILIGIVAYSVRLSQTPTASPAPTRPADPTAARGAPAPLGSAPKSAGQQLALLAESTAALYESIPLLSLSIAALPLVTSAAVEASAS